MLTHTGAPLAEGLASSAQWVVGFRFFATRGHPCTVGALLTAHDWRHQSSALLMHPFPTRGRKEKT